jgi:hypothetical protein
MNLNMKDYNTIYKNDIVKITNDEDDLPIQFYIKKGFKSNNKGIYRLGLFKNNNLAA